MDKCQKYINMIGYIIKNKKNKIWKDADNRIYFIDSINADFSRFYENTKIRSVLKNYIGTDNPVELLFCCKNSISRGEFRFWRWLASRFTNNSTV
jgi:hypothetical protein